MTAATKFALLDRSIGWNIVSYACCSLIALNFSINFDIIQKHKRARNQKTMFHAPSLAKWFVPRHFSDSEYLGIKELTLTPDQYLQSLEGVFKTVDTHRFTCSVFLVGRLQATIFLILSHEETIFSSSHPSQTWMLQHLMWMLAPASWSSQDV